MFDSEIMLLAPGSVTTALATDSMNRTIEPGGQLLFSFLANKGTGAPCCCLHPLLLPWLALPCTAAGCRRKLCSMACWWCRAPATAAAAMQPVSHTAKSCALRPHPFHPSAGELNASNPYNVGAIQGVTFNNLRCSMVMAAPQPQAPPALPPAAEAAAQPTDLQIEYTPIECEWGEVVMCFSWQSVPACCKVQPPASMHVRAAVVPCNIMLS